jgi:hypothetical protein
LIFEKNANINAETEKLIHHEKNVITEQEMVEIENVQMNVKKKLLPFVEMEQ